MNIQQQILEAANKEYHYWQVSTGHLLERDKFIKIATFGASLRDKEIEELRKENELQTKVIAGLRADLLSMEMLMGYKIKR